MCIQTHTLTRLSSNYLSDSWIGKILRRLCHGELCSNIWNLKLLFVILIKLSYLIYLLKVDWMRKFILLSRDETVKMLCYNVRVCVFYFLRHCLTCKVSQCQITISFCPQSVICRGIATGPPLKFPNQTRFTNFSLKFRDIAFYRCSEIIGEILDLPKNTAVEFVIKHFW